MLGPYLSSYVLIITAVDRYQAICNPLGNCTWTPKRSQVSICIRLYFEEKILDNLEIDSNTQTMDISFKIFKVSIAKAHVILLWQYLSDYVNNRTKY